MRQPSIPTTITINGDDNKQIIMMKMLYNTLIELREPKTNRVVISLFMCLPSRKDFPEYFDIIEKPIAMNRIRERIERQIYRQLENCLDDFKLLFANCKIFNEDDSQIYKDAVILESLLEKRKLELMQEFNIKDNSAKDGTNNSLTQQQHQATTAATSNNSKLDTSSHNKGNSSKLNSLNQSIDQRENNHSTVKVDNEILVNGGTTNANSSTTNATNTANSLNNNINNQHSATSNHKSSLDATNKSNNNTSGKDTIVQQQFDSTNDSVPDQLNGNDEFGNETIHKIIHNHHIETSMDSSSNLSSDLLASTPVEKCSLNKRRSKNPDGQKRLQLTGYIIYASEIRKEVIDKNPNQNFGDISRLVGNEWKALPSDIREKYNERAKRHNNIVRIGRQSQSKKRPHEGDDSMQSNGVSTPKMSHREMARLTKEQMRQFHLNSGHDDSSTLSQSISQDYSSPMVSRIPNSTSKHHPQHSQTQSAPQVASSKVSTEDSSTQTTTIRFVEPPNKKRLVYSETFRKYIESLQVPNRDLLAEETAPERPPEAAETWLGAGLGRHESPEAALWALRDFMLQDAVSMRRSMEPYL